MNLNAIPSQADCTSAQLTWDSPPIQNGNHISSMCFNNGIDHSVLQALFWAMT